MFIELENIATLLQNIKPQLTKLKEDITLLDKQKEELSDELERTHIFLDSLNVPRMVEGREYTSEDLSLIGRIKIALGRRDYR